MKLSMASTALLYACSSALTSGVSVSDFADVGAFRVQRVFDMSQIEPRPDKCLCPRNLTSFELQENEGESLSMRGISIHLPWSFSLLPSLRDHGGLTWFGFIWREATGTLSSFWASEGVVAGKEFIQLLKRNDFSVIDAHVFVVFFGSWRGGGVRANVEHKSESRQWLQIEVVCMIFISWIRRGCQLCSPWLMMSWAFVNLLFY